MVPKAKPEPKLNGTLGSGSFEILEAKATP